MSNDNKCWVCGKDIDPGDPLMFIDKVIVGNNSYDTYGLCEQCAPIAEEYYQEWRRDLRGILHYRVKGLGHVSKGLLQWFKEKSGF